MRLKYGHGTIEFQIPQTLGVDRAELGESPMTPETQLIENALETADFPLHSLLYPQSKVAVIISDYTRPTGTQVYVPMLISQLEESGIPYENITIVIALGLHRPAERDEMIELVTEPVWDRVKVENHSVDSHLLTVDGTGFNRTVASADLVILTGSVTFHPMAGFSGGYKGLLPGVASREAIIENHRLYFREDVPHPHIGPASVSGNPVLEDLMQRSRGISPVFCLNVVLGEGKRVRFASAGSVRSAWGACCRYLTDTSRYLLDQQYPLVIASAGGYPSDFSFYQCMKILTNASRAALPGGRIIIIAECSQGWEIDRDIFDFFRMPLKEVARRLHDHFRMDGLAVYMAMKVIHDYRISILTNLETEEVQNTGMQKILSAEHLSQILQEQKKYTPSLLMPLATQVLPVLKERDV